jgi:hypothetical protein
VAGNGCEQSAEIKAKSKMNGCSITVGFEGKGFDFLCQLLMVATSILPTKIVQLVNQLVAQAQSLLASLLYPIPP